MSGTPSHTGHTPTGHTPWTESQRLTPFSKYPELRIDSGERGSGVGNPEAGAPCTAFTAALNRSLVSPSRINWNLLEAPQQEREQEQQQAVIDEQRQEIQQLQPDPEIDIEEGAAQQEQHEQQQEIEAEEEATATPTQQPQHEIEIDEGATQQQQKAKPEIDSPEAEEPAPTPKKRRVTI